MTPLSSSPADARAAIPALFDEATGTIDPRIYTDPALYDQELAHVFAGSWLFLCHESQIKKPGAYLTTYMGEDPVVVCRQIDGNITAFLNQCRHRGMRICRSDAGIARSFTCTYHGWGYDAGGRLLAVPNEKAAFGEQGVDKAAWSARPVGRIESYKGLVFGHWSAQAEPLADYLGDIAWYLDAMIDRSPAGMEAYGGVVKWVVPANWKLPAEQVCSDMYHGMTTHLSLSVAGVTSGLMPPPASGPVGAQFRAARNGHGTGFMSNPETRANFHRALAGESVPGWDPSREVAAASDRLGEARAGLGLQHALVFPNLGLFDGACALRVFHPRGPNEVEVWSIGLVPADATPEEREQMRLAQIRGLGPAGLLEQDDGENWVEVQSVLRGWQARRTPLTAQMGLGRATRSHPRYPGLVDDNVLSEEAARGFYAHWQSLMARGQEQA